MRAAVSKMSKHLAQSAASTKLKEIKMPAGAQPMRIDTFLAAPEYFHLSRTHAQRLIDNGDVFVNGKSVLKKSLHVKPLDNVAVELQEAAPTPTPAPQTAPQIPQPTPKKQLSKKKIVEKKEDDEGEGENEEVDEASEAVDDADELEAGPKTTGGPMVNPIDILFYAKALNI